MNSLPALLLELSKAAAAAQALDFFREQSESVQAASKEAIEGRSDELADALHQAGEYIAAIAGEYEVEIG